MSEMVVVRGVELASVAENQEPGWTLYSGEQGISFKFLSRYRRTASRRDKREYLVLAAVALGSTGRAHLPWQLNTTAKARV